MRLWFSRLRGRGPAQRFAEGRSLMRSAGASPSINDYCVLSMT